MKYKVGDKVRIKPELEDKYGDYIVNISMRTFCGKICTISSVLNDCYFLKEDERWYWTDEMIEYKICFETPDWVCIEKDEEPKTAMEVEERNQRLRTRMEALYRNVTYGAFGGRRPGKQKELDTIKENKEDIEMSKTELIENKLEKELDALRKARDEEVRNKFYETSIGKAAKAFNEALEQDGNENQKDNYLINIEDLMEHSEVNLGKEIYDKYNAKREEVKEYYAEAKSLFENADTYEQKHEILTAYGILKGPKAKAKVEVK